MTADPLFERVRVSPERTALVDPESGVRHTYGDLNRAVASIARQLPDIEPGGRVAVLRRTSIDAVYAIHAAWRLGATVVPLGPNLGTQALKEHLATAAPSFVIGPSSEDRTTVESIEAPVVQIPEVETDPDPVSKPARLEWTDPMLVLFTSGTTGEPKPVPLTMANLAASATASAFRLGVLPTDNWLCCLPINHMGGLAPIIRSTVYGTAITVHEGFDVEAIAESVDTGRPTGISLVPTQLRRLLAGGVSLRSLRFVLLGGAPAPTSLINRCQREDVPVYPTYGLTETASQVTTATPEEAFTHDGTVGRPLLVTSVTVVDETGEPVADGTRGEIVVDGPTVMPGYADDTDAPFGDYGLHTGDIGYLEDGRLWVTGRLSDVIVSGGEQVHPREVSDVIRSHPAVDDVAVVGLDDPEWGERVAALVAGESITADDVEYYTRDRLAPFKVPKTWAVDDDLPRTDSGTIDRAAVRRRLRGVNNGDVQ